jgi:hypothetical protein
MVLTLFKGNVSTVDVISLSNQLSWLRKVRLNENSCGLCKGTNNEDANLYDIIYRYRT